ncbi:hypothetical protein ANO11243_034180 [Dothideomycetidae sp. 11243]|nr:hypothetical protein ANO11243_034180 [fungal sp. No.11243]
MAAGDPEKQPDNKIEELGLNDSHLKREDMIRAVNALADDPNVTIDTFAHLDVKKILIKLDLHLIPMLTLLYLFSYLDRGNIGNAKIEGLMHDLRLNSSMFNWCMTSFVLVYSVCEVPSILLLRRFRPSIYLPGLMVLWGLVLTLSGFAHNYTGLLITRVCLAIAEAGLYPGMVYLVTVWYCRYEIQVRQAYFFAAASAAGAFSGLLAYAISFMAGIGNLSGWRWIFILEGLATILVAFVAHFFIPDNPHTASFLTAEERIFIVHRTRQSSSSRFTWPILRETMTDPQIYLAIIIYWGYICPLYGLTLYLPSLIEAMHHSPTTTQLLTIPIYLTACVLTICLAHLSDKLHLRSPILALCLTIQLACFIALTHLNLSLKSQYAALFLLTAAVYPCQPAALAWLANNVPHPAKRALAMGMLIGLGNAGSAFAARFYTDGEYTRGHRRECVMVAAGLGALGVQVVRFWVLNRRRARREGQMWGRTGEGDEGFGWRYTL